VKVLITGAGGQLGRALQVKAPQDATVIALTRADLDVTDAAAVARIVMEHKPDLLFNAAAFTNVDRAEREWDSAQAVNSTAVGFLAEAAVHAGARFVHISTDYVFGGTRSQPYRPDDMPDPVNAYGHSKWAGERAALAVNPKSLIVRTAWLYAPEASNFVSTVLRSLSTQPQIEVVADQMGSPTYAPGLAGALWTLARQGATGILHYSDSGVASRYDFAVAIQEEAYALGLCKNTASIAPVATLDDDKRAKRPAVVVLEKSRTWMALGSKAPHWRTNLRTMLRDVRARG